MPYRTRVAAIALAWGIGASTEVTGAEPTDLQLRQQPMAKCMLAVLSAQRGVAESSLRFDYDSDPGRVHIFLDYTYHHRDHHVSPRVSKEEIEITDMVFNKKPGLILDGLVTPGSDMNDVDSGMPKVIDQWQKKCGLDPGTVLFE